MPTSLRTITLHWLLLSNLFVTTKHKNSSSNSLIAKDNEVPLSLRASEAILS
jgi:hypothetical protein